ncbi:hypothetical protein [Desulfotomaculum sp. 1211_IL3151]|uniref:hypothetical protein n=1 Tax=Desulfotomaculum sp. 1211_IL3151 TaxID=3084055 RepID=UPI002FDB069D
MRIVETGDLIEAVTGVCPFQMILLDPGYLPAIEALQALVLSNLEKKELCVRLTGAEIKNILAGQGLALGVIVKRRLVAFCALCFPGRSEDNLGREYGLPEAELSKVTHLEITLIAPDYRGNDLQRRMFKHLGQLAQSLGRWRYLYSTIAPANYPSLKAVMKQGLLIVDLKQKYNHYWRYILFQNMDRPLQLDRGQVIPVPPNDLAAQQKLLQAGYIGFASRQGPEGVQILYGRRLTIT